MARRSRKKRNPVLAPRQDLSPLTHDLRERLQAFTEPLYSWEGKFPSIDQWLKSNWTARQGKAIVARFLQSVVALRKGHRDGIHPAKLHPLYVERDKRQRDLAKLFSRLARAEMSGEKVYKTGAEKLVREKWREAPEYEGHRVAGQVLKVGKNPAGSVDDVFDALEILRDTIPGKPTEGRFEVEKGGASLKVEGADAHALVQYPRTSVTWHYDDDGPRASMRASLESQRDDWDVSRKVSIQGRGHAPIVPVRALKRMGYGYGDIPFFMKGRRASSWEVGAEGYIPVPLVEQAVESGDFEVIEEGREIAAMLGELNNPYHPRYPIRENARPSRWERTPPSPELVAFFAKVRAALAEVRPPGKFNEKDLGTPAWQVDKWFEQSWPAAWVPSPAHGLFNNLILNMKMLKAIEGVKPWEEGLTPYYENLEGLNSDEILERWEKQRNKVYNTGKKLYDQIEEQAMRSNPRRVRFVRNPRGKKDLYDPRLEQVRSIRQGIYETSIRKLAGAPYNAPFRDPVTGKRMDVILIERQGPEVVAEAQRKMFAIGTAIPAKYGRLLSGTQEPTPKCAAESKARYEGAHVGSDGVLRTLTDLVTNRQNYEESLGMTRKSGFYRAVPEITVEGIQYFVWPLPPGTHVPVPMSAADAAARAGSLNRSSDPRRTGRWWTPRSRSYSRSELSGWLPPVSAFGALPEREVAVPKAPKAEPKPRKARKARKARGAAAPKPAGLPKKVASQGIRSIYEDVDSGGRTIYRIFVEESDTGTYYFDLAFAKSMM